MTYVRPTLFAMTTAKRSLRWLPACSLRACAGLRIAFQHLMLTGGVLALGACGGGGGGGGATQTVTATASAPVVTLQPLDVTVSAPNTATLTAAASGVPMATVQWYLSGNGVTWTLIGGATGASFTTPATTLAQSGTLYRATFTNASGSVNSNPATLTVTTEPRLLGPAQVALDAQGNLYIADLPSQTIRKLTPAGALSTLAGQFMTPGSANGTGSAARFGAPSGVAVDAAGTVYVADLQNQTIRKITPDGVVTTFAGMNGVLGGTDGTGTAASFNVPVSLAVDTAGNVYVADAGDSTIRKITPAGVVTTLAGVSGTTGSADGAPGVALFDAPLGIAVDAAGNVYVTDNAHNVPVIVNGSTIRKIAPDGTVSTLAGLAGHPGSADGIGSAARFNIPSGVAVDAAGNLFVVDSENDTIRMITPGGVVSTVAGSAGVRGNTDGTGSAALFRLPNGCAIDAAGNLYIGDEGNGLVRKMTPADVVTTIAR